MFVVIIRISRVFTEKIQHWRENKAKKKAIYIFGLKYNQPHSYRSRVYVSWYSRQQIGYQVLHTFGEKGG
jgi:hypothetical protein